jgi:hypothetical protein
MKTGSFMLHVEKVEARSFNSLDNRNGQLDALAVKHGVQAYDGMDLGPVAPATNPTATPPAG